MQLQTYPRGALAGVSLGGDVGAGTILWSALSLGSMALSAYHGYKRNDSVGWAIWWGFLGSVFPVLTPAIAFAQGFGQRK